MTRSRVPLAASALAIALTLGATAPPPAQAQSSGSYTSTRAETYSTADLQRALDNAGYDPGPIDGIMGSGTRRAITAFQRDNNLTATGQANAALYKALERQGFLTARMAAPHSDMTGPDARVSELQRSLARAGYDVGRIDGEMDAQTRTAVRSLQRDAGLVPTGEVDNRTLAALRERDPMLSPRPAPAAEPQRAGVDPALVEDIQLALREAGFQDLRVTGSLNAETRAAIRSWQRQAGLPASGLPSAELLALIEDRAGDSWPPAQTAEAPGADRPRDELIEQTEIALTNKGYTTGPINEVLEPQSVAAIRQYQQQRGLAQTGEVSDDLLLDIRQAGIQAPADEAPQQAQDPATQLFRLLGEQAIERIQNR